MRDSLAAQPSCETVRIREATEHDWPQIYPFFSIIAGGRTYAYPENLSSEEARTYRMQGPPGVTVVAVDASTVLGTAPMGPNRPGRDVRSAAPSIMVDPPVIGGVRHALGEYVVDRARVSGYHRIQFNAVVDTNTAAVQLWHLLGFEILATVPEALDHPEYGLVGLHVMSRRV